MRGEGGVVFENKKKGAGFTKKNNKSILRGCGLTMNQNSKRSVM